MRTPIAVFSICLFLTLADAGAQVLRQNIRGSITDQISMAPLPGDAVYIQSQRYESSHKDYFRTDFGVRYRMNRKRVSHTFSLDIQNITNHENEMYDYYDPENNNIVTEYHLGILPVLAYKIEF